MQRYRGSRREFLIAAAAASAEPLWAASALGAAPVNRGERRAFFPEGVASGDPASDSIVLWTRRPLTGSNSHLRVEVSEDEAFRRVIALKRVPILAEADWTCRVLVGNLRASTIYWYRFVDAHGFASRVGRTRTAPGSEDARSARFSFVSCQSINTGASNAFRRMIFEDMRASGDDQLDFVLHLGDFVYELVWYPEDNPNGFYGRKLYDVVRYPQGERIDLGDNGIAHSPVGLEDYRILYRAHLADPDLQDARARWPFICIWDNEEFSDNNWQSMRIERGKSVASQTRKVAANQAWFEYQPARVTKPSGPSLDRFQAPKVADVMPSHFDAQGLGLEPNNLAAIGSLTAYRALRYGAHVDLLLTDLFSYKSEPASLSVIGDGQFTGLYPQEALAVLDSGRAYGGGNPPEVISLGEKTLSNMRKASPPQTLLGTQQKAWFLERLKSSGASWKIWCQSQGNLFERVDMGNLPPNIANPWPGVEYATAGVAIAERQEICDTVRDGGVTGFVTVSGNRHSFWAGFTARALPPEPFLPVGVNFITAAISSTSPAEYYANLPAEKRPLGQLMIAERAGGPEPVLNLLYRHGFRTAAEYAASGDIGAARALSNPMLSPHIRFLDMAAHGYALVTASADALTCEFVCIDIPRERANTPNGGPVRYRVIHRARLWQPGEAPRLEQQVIEGNPLLSL